jgi:exosome complex component RRP42
VEIKVGPIAKAEGSAFVTIGQTKVIAGVKVGMGQPFPDTPNEGTIVVNAEFTPLASPDFEAGPPSGEATELARVVDRGIRESHCIDLKKLCITEGEKVITLFIDIHIINHGGNLIDASFLAAMSALKTAKMPKIEDDMLVRGDYEKDLEVTHTPIEVTVCRVDDKILLDPDIDEESGMQSKLTVCTREDDMVCALQKQGAEGLTMEEVKSMIELAMEKSKELRKILEKSIKK